MNLKEAKTVCRNYLKTKYTDRDLVRGLEHARRGLLVHYSCCCFAGVSAQAGELRASYDDPAPAGHVDHECEAGTWASVAYNLLADGWSHHYSGIGAMNRAEDALRQRRIIPMFLAEIRRRGIERNAKEGIVYDGEAQFI
jgi:hypothetical protein